MYQSKLERNDHLSTHSLSEKLSSSPKHHKYSLEVEVDFEKEILSQTLLELKCILPCSNKNETTTSHSTWSNDNPQNPNTQLVSETQ